MKCFRLEYYATKNLWRKFIILEGFSEFELLFKYRETESSRAENDFAADMPQNYFRRNILVGAGG